MKIHKQKIKKTFTWLILLSTLQLFFQESDRTYDRINPVDATSHVLLISIYSENVFSNFIYSKGSRNNQSSIIDLHKDILFNQKTSKASSLKFLRFYFSIKEYTFRSLTVCNNHSLRSPPHIS